MEGRAPASGGLLGSLRGLADGLLGSAQERLELISIELHEEKYRLVQTLIWISAAVFSAMMTITFASLTIVYLFWDTARLAVLGGLTVLYGIASLVIVWLCRRFIARQPKPFEATIDELQEDRTCIRPRS
jgi:uncharacterized membrane protein YqjE